MLFSGDILVQKMFSLPNCGIFTCLHQGFQFYEFSILVEIDNLLDNLRSFEFSFLLRYKFSIRVTIDINLLSIMSVVVCFKLL